MIVITEGVFEEGVITIITQKEQILIHLKEEGPITPIEALSKYGVYRLSDCIYRLRADGYKIDTKIKRNNFGQYAEYSLKEG